jgi:hemerythrin superfamily protein
MGTSKTGGNEVDAIELLKADHKRVKALFAEFKRVKEGKGDPGTTKHSTVKQICSELKIHTELEETIFYPAVRQEIDDTDLMDEALVEHAGAKRLVAELESMDPSDDLYDAKVTVLSEQIDHHVNEEEGKMFREVKKAKVDTASLGAKMAQRKAALQQNFADSEELGPSGAGRTSKGARRGQRV